MSLHLFPERSTAPIAVDLDDDYLVSLDLDLDRDLSVSADAVAVLSDRFEKELPKGAYFAADSAGAEFRAMAQEAIGLLELACSTPRISRQLTPDDARALAAALWHYAGQAEGIR